MRLQRILLSLVMAVLIIGVSVPLMADKEDQERPEPTPVGQVRIKITEVGLGLGVTWGKGTLSYKGKEYKFKVRGLNAVALGVSAIEAKGEVYNLRKLDDFAGKYVGMGEGAALVKGRAGLVVKNFSGVVLNLKSSQTGLALKLANEGLSITPEWD